MRTTMVVLTGLCLALAACSDQAADPSSPSTALGETPSPSPIAVMTQNMYIGADVDAVIGALASPDTADDLPALMTAIATLQATDYPARAAAMADEIAKANPDFIALQEVSQVDVDLSALGGPTVHLDFLPVLLGELSRRGLSYAVTGAVQNIVAQPFPGISVIDYDVVLTNPARVGVLSINSAPYSVNIGVVAPGVELKRGRVIVRALVNGRRVTVAGTHLESGTSADIQAVRAAQAAELAQLLAADTSAIVMGDLNDGPGSGQYQAFTGAGFVDAWAALHPGDQGLTCCQTAPDLSNQTPTFDQRIDMMLLKGLTGENGKIQGRITIVGNTPGDRVDGPAGKIWPSDHAGLSATLMFGK